MKQIHYLNGKFVTEDGLLISPRDLGFTRSYAVFEYFRTYNLRPFKLEMYLQRLLRSADLIGLKHKYDVKKLVDITNETLTQNKWNEEKSVKIILSGGKSGTLWQSSEASLFVIIDVLKLKDEKVYKKGAKVKLIDFIRHIPEAKTTNYIEAVRRNQTGMYDDYFELIYQTNRQIHEGMTSNIFVVKDGKIYTTKSNILFGITRGVLVQDLKDELAVIENDFDVDFLLNADEVFITSSGKKVVPVVAVDDCKIGNGKVGRITKKVMRLFYEYTQTYSIT